MVDDEIDGRQRIDLLRIAAERPHGIAHGGEIDDGRNAGEILHQHAGRAKGDFAFLLAAVPSHSTPVDVVAGHGAAILVTKEIFEQHLERKGQPRNAREAVLFGRLS